MITTPAETSTVLGSPVANCPGYVPPTPPPPVPSTIVADLTGIDFSAGGNFTSSFTFLLQSTIRVEFINNAGANMNNAQHIQFSRFELPTFSPSDTFTIENPTYIPTTQFLTFGPGNIYSIVYANEPFGLSQNSIITFSGANEISTLTFQISQA